VSAATSGLGEGSFRWRWLRRIVHLAAGAAIALCLLLAGSRYDGLRDIAPDIDTAAFEDGDDRGVVLGAALVLAALAESAVLATAGTVRARVGAVAWLAALLATALWRFAT
jgi:hypothetical protein